MASRRMNGAADQALLDTVLRTAVQNGWPLQVGMVHHENGQFAATEARLDEALAHYEAAWAAFEDAGSASEIATLLESRAWVYKAKGDTESAQADLNQALDSHRAAGDQMRELNTINSLAFTFLAEGDYSASREVAQMGVQLGRELGHRGAEAGCWTTLGEIERFEGNIDASRECYRRAEVLDTMCGSAHVLLVRANASLLEVGGRNWDEALRQMDVVEPAMVSRGQGWMGPFFALARSCCHFGRGEWVAGDLLWDSATERIDASQIMERDVAWLAEIAADVTEEAGDTARASRALNYALGQWRGLGDERESQRTLARLVVVNSTETVS